MLVESMTVQPPHPSASRRPPTLIAFRAQVSSEVGDGTVEEEAGDEESEDAVEASEGRW
jgi:hypothetical protein